jgi:hypothetical protein
MSVDSIGMTLSTRDSIRFWASRSEEWACLTIKTEGTYCEIAMDREHVEAVRNQLPDVLAGLDLWAAEQAECEKAGIAAQRAVTAAARALDLAMAAETAGAADVAASLRKVATEASAKADAVDAAVQAFENAAAEADQAAEKLTFATDEAETALRRPRADKRPAELAGTAGAVTP